MLKFSQLLIFYSIVKKCKKKNLSKLKKFKETRFGRFLSFLKTYCFKFMQQKVEKTQKPSDAGFLKLFTFLQCCGEKALLSENVQIKIMLDV